MVGRQAGFSRCASSGAIQRLKTLFKRVNELAFVSDCGNGGAGTDDWLRIGAIVAKVENAA